MKILVKTIVLWLLLAGLAQAGEPRQWEPILPLPKRTDLDPARVALGKALFFDARLSSDGTVSCATCHQMRYGGTDDKVPSQGVGREGDHQGADRLQHPLQYRPVLGRAGAQSARSARRPGAQPQGDELQLAGDWQDAEGGRGLSHAFPEGVSGRHQRKDAQGRTGHLRGIAGDGRLAFRPLAEGG